MRRLLRWVGSRASNLPAPAAGRRRPRGFRPAPGCETRPSMDFDLSDDQVALRDGARELLDGLASPARVRAHTGTDAAYDAALWAAMAEQGWLGIEVPEDAGGVGLGTVEVAVLCEELGRHAAPAPFVPTVLAIDAFRDGRRRRVGRPPGRRRRARVRRRGTRRRRCRTRRRPTSRS